MESEEEEDEDEVEEDDPMIIHCNGLNKGPEGKTCHPNNPGCCNDEKHEEFCKWVPSPNGKGVCHAKEDSSDLELPSDEDISLSDDDLDEDERSAAGTGLIGGYNPLFIQIGNGTPQADIKFIKFKYKKNIYYTKIKIKTTKNPGKKSPKKNISFDKIDKEISEYDKVISNVIVQNILDKNLLKKQKWEKMKLVKNIKDETKILILKKNIKTNEDIIKKINLYKNLPDSFKMKPIHFLIDKKKHKITGFKLENGTCIHFKKKEISTKYSNKYLLDYIKYNKDELIDNNLIEEYENLPAYIDQRVITMNMLYYEDSKYKHFYHYCMKKIQKSSNKKTIISVINNDDNITSKFENLKKIMDKILMEQNKVIKEKKKRYDGKSKIPLLTYNNIPRLHESYYKEFMSKFIINLITNKYYLNQLKQTKQVYLENQVSKYYKADENEKFFTDMDYNVIFLKSLYGVKSKAKKIVNNKF